MQQNLIIIINTLKSIVHLIACADFSENVAMLSKGASCFGESTQSDNTIESTSCARLINGLNMIGVTYEAYGMVFTITLGISYTISMVELYGKCIGQITITVNTDQYTTVRKLKYLLNHLIVLVGQINWLDNAAYHVTYLKTISILRQSTFVWQ